MQYMKKLNLMPFAQKEFQGVLDLLKGLKD
jgi:hypothetical protein